ncbi:hypothetical protein [Roseibium alexandrii]|uniref:Uncharacterized protein n=1 Tax=Roseibium alexandrii TaxID=388408 RepID=A0A0M6ZNJ7_9HYPH|nr:hypothetical protein [Roseibium alexandrii]CTQ64328.1 hypothetical protein LAX5112_00258 [Roseibium alexandrii]
MNLSILSDNYKVYVCNHVFQNQRSVTLAVLEDGDLSLLCGEDDHSDSAADYKVAGFRHIADNNPHIVRIENLNDGNEAIFNATGQWIFSPLEEN